MYPRRDFVKDLFAAGLLPGLAPAAGAAAFLPQAAGQTPEPDPESAKFWSEFLDYQSIPVSMKSGAAVRSSGADAGGDAREPFFLHFGAQGLKAAEDLAEGDLLPGGDVTIGLSVAGFRPADADRQAFERFVNAQLRIDVVQSNPILDTLDVLAWAAIAAVHPDRTNKLPPLENLSFAPGETWQRMQNIALPGGEGSWAVNIFAERQESAFTKILRAITGGVDKFAPALGLPEISKTALRAFNRVYASFAERPQFIFKGNPVAIYATGAALRSQSSSRGVPLKTGTYVMLPNEHLKYLGDEKLENYEIRRGLIVPRGTTTIQARDRALTTLPNITYATLDVTVKPTSTGCNQRGGAQAQPPIQNSAPPGDAQPRNQPAGEPPTSPADPTGRGRSGRGR
jgi:hypothetical protein